MKYMPCCGKYLAGNGDLHLHPVLMPDGALYVTEPIVVAPLGPTGRPWAFNKSFPQIFVAVSYFPRLYLSGTLFITRLNGNSEGKWPLCALTKVTPCSDGKWPPDRERENINRKQAVGDFKPNSLLFDMWWKKSLTGVSYVRNEGVSFMRILHYIAWCGWHFGVWWYMIWPVAV